MLGLDSLSGHKQHSGSVLHKHGGWYEVWLSLCTPLEAAVLVQPTTDSAEGQAHKGSSECYSRQIVQTLVGDSYGVVPPRRGVPLVVLPVAPASSGFFFANRFNRKLPRFVSLVPVPTAWKVD